MIKKSSIICPPSLRDSEFRACHKAKKKQVVND
jgi:hypothetical protein